MKNHVLGKVLSAVVLFSILLSSCAPSSSSITSDCPAIDITSFRNEDGAYVYLGKDWGASPEEISQWVCMALEEPVAYYAGEQFSFSGSTLENQPFLGEDWVVQYQFDENDGLFIVSIFLQDETEKVERFFEKLSPEMQKLYGEPDETVNSPLQWDGETQDRETLVWRAPLDGGETMMVLTQEELGKNNLSVVSIGLKYWSESRIAASEQSSES